MSPEVRRRRRMRGWRRLRRHARQRPLIWAGAGIGLLLLVAVAWSVWRAVAVAQDLSDVERNARIMRAAMARGDVETARSAVEDYQAAAEAAADGTDGPVWRAFEALPVVGDDAEAVDVVAVALRGIGREGLPPLVEAAEDVTARSFHPQDGTFPVQRVASVEQPARRSEQAFADAEKRLADVDPDLLLGGVRQRFLELDQLVGDARSTLDAAYRAARLMPSLLGGEGPRHYLLVMQNNAELRSSGGLPGSVSVVRADGGHVDIVEQLDMADLEGTTEPVLPLSTAESTLFGRVLGTVGVNATLTPHFPRSADLIRARWERQGGQELDGVFLVDPVAVSYLLQSTGPVAVPGHGAVTAGNVVAQVENQIYVRTPRPDEHSAFQNAVAEAVFDAFAGGRGDPVRVIRALATAVGEGRIRMHSFVAEDQQVVAGTQIAGEMPREAGSGPRVGVYLNDAGETKMSYYLRYDATLTARSCSGGVQDLVGTISLTNDTPDGVADLPATVLGYAKERRRIEDGQQLLVVYVTSPVGGEIVELDVGPGGPRDPAVQRYRGREVATVTVLLDPGEAASVEYRARSGRGQIGATDLFVTPGATAGSESETVRSAC